VDGPAGVGRGPDRKEVAAASLEAGLDASGVPCPNCDGRQMQTIRSDAEENRFWSITFMGAGIATLVIIVIAGDADFVVADLSTIALLLLLVGAFLHAAARWRRRPSAYECPECGYRVS
jgi:predicted RNA-binding Zn-ribbon protein involved in translation (DUF1610 family)